jgi:peptide-methionine (R)-S-oxide reductase
MKRTTMIALILAGTAALASAKTPAAPRIVPVVKTDAEWRKALTPAQYRVLRTEGTEIAFTGKYWNQHAKGTYVCAGCGLPLFASDTKYDSGTGWPSFWQPIAAGNVHQSIDHDGYRNEVECARCGGHLGHVFDDGPRPTGLRYCINSAALAFQPAR